MQIGRVRVGLDTAFAFSPSWLAVPKTVVFPTVLSNFIPFYTENLVFNALNDDVGGADFIGIKIGDVNFSADPN